MKIKPGFMLREVGGVSVVVAIGVAAQQFHGIANLNATGAFLFRELSADASADTLVKRLTEEFDVSAEVAATDLEAFLQGLRNAGMLED